MGQIGEPIDEIVFAVTRKKLDEMKQIFLMCEELGIRTRIAMNFFSNKVARIEIEELEGIPFLTFTTTPSNETQLAFKRLLDVTVSLVILALAAPVTIIVALAIKATSPGSVFFKQNRVGLNGRKFTLYKFRTMIEDAHARRGEVEHLNEMTAPVFKAKDDPRITPVGRFLRRFSFDELPQLWNVLMGDMSVVGPRPERPQFVEQFRAEFPHYMLRHKVRAGMTGWAQVHGWRGNTSVRMRIEHDLYYIENWSLALDVKILFMTVIHGLRHENAY